MTASLRPVGRPRSADLDDALLDAALVEYGLHGLDALRMEAVAARAGAGKAAIYRRWGSKLALVAAALERRGEQAAVPSTGSLEGDVRAVLRHLADLTADPVHGTGLRHIVGDGMRNPELAAVHAAFVARRRAHTKGLLEQAIARGELRTDVDLDVATDALSGPIFNRHLITHLPIDDAFLGELQAAFLRAYAV